MNNGSQINTSNFTCFKILINAHGKFKILKSL